MGNATESPFRVGNLERLLERGGVCIGFDSRRCRKGFSRIKRVENDGCSCNIKQN